MMIIQVTIRPETRTEETLVKAAVLLGRARKAAAAGSLHGLEGVGVYGPQRDMNGCLTYRVAAVRDREPRSTAGVVWGRPADRRWTW